ncbi:MAG: sister chromatid cohesion protein PDS5 [Bacteroidota bacterium]
MNTRDAKLSNCYTQGQRSAARILLVVWLLTSCSPDITLAAPEGGRAMVTTTIAPDPSAPGALTLPPASGPAMERALQQRMSQQGASSIGRDLRRTSIQVTPLGENLSFQARGGEQVRFHYEAGQWRAEVLSRIGNFARQSLLPVVCSLGEDVASSLEVLSKYPSWYSQRQIHVLDRNVCPTLGEVVYLGELGLKGGGEGEASGSEGTTGVQTPLQTRVAHGDITSTQGLVAALNNTQDPQEQAVLEEWLAAYIIRHFPKQSVQDLVSNDSAYLPEYNQLTHIQPLSERTKGLLRSYFDELSGKIDKEANLYTKLPLLESLVYALNHVDKQVFGNNSAPLIELANKLLDRLDPSQVVFSANGYPTHGTTLDALHQVLYLVGCIDPSWDSTDKDRIYKRFRQHLEAIDQAAQQQQHYPTSYHTQLLRQILASLELNKAEAQLQDIVRRTFAGIQGLRHVYQGLRGLVVLDIQLESLKAAYDHFLEVLRSDRVEKQPWYAAHQALRLSSLLSLKAEDSGLHYYQQFGSHVDAFLSESKQGLRRKQYHDKLKKCFDTVGKEGRKALRYGIVQYLVELALYSPSSSVRANSVLRLANLAAVWREEADIVTALLDGLADVAVCEGIDNQKMAYEKLANVVLSTSAGQEVTTWLGGQSLDAKLEARPMSSSRPTGHELFQSVKAEIARDFKPQVDLTPVLNRLDFLKKQPSITSYRHLEAQVQKLSAQISQLQASHHHSSDDSSFQELSYKLDRLSEQASQGASNDQLESLLKTLYTQFDQLQEVLLRGSSAADPISPEEREKIRAQLVSHYSSESFARVETLFPDARVETLFSDQPKKHVKDLPCQLMLREQRLVKDDRDKEDKQDKGREDQVASHHRRLEEVQTPINLRELFKDRSTHPNKPVQTVHRVLLTGDPGTGKTTVSKQLAYQWSVHEWGPEFANLYLLPVRNLQQDKYNDDNYRKQKTLATAIVNNCFTSPSNEEKYNLLREHIEEELKSSATLVILDGLDERSGASQELLRQAQAGAHKLLMLSRPYGIDTERRIADIEIDHRGFNDEQLKGYVRGEVSPTASAEELLSYIYKHANIHSIAHVPVNLQIFCALWQDQGYGVQEELKQGSLPGLYRLFAEFTWQRYTQKRESADEDEEEVFDTLGQIALAALKQGEVLISPGLVHQHTRKGKLKARLKDTGFLLLKHVGNTLSARSSFYQLPHLTFQEYFAGRTLASQFLSANPRAKQRAHTFLSRHKYAPQYARTLSFMAGEVSKSEGVEGIQALLRCIKKDKEIVGVQHLCLQLRVLHEWLCIAQEEVEEEMAMLEREFNVRNSLRSWFKKAFKHVPEAVHGDNSQLLDLLRRSLQDFGTIASRTPELFQLFKDVVGDEDKHVHAVAFGFLSSLVQADPTLAQEAFAIILETLKGEDDLVLVAALGCLSSLVQAAPDRAQEAFAIILEALKDEDDRVYAAALGAFSSLVQAAPDRAQEAFSIIRMALKDEDKRVRAAAFGSLSSLVQASSDGAQEALQSIRAALNAEDRIVRKAALGSLSSLVQVSPGLAQEALQSIRAALNDKDRIVRKVAFDSLSSLVQSSPDRAQEAFAITQEVFKVQDGDWRVREAALGFLSSLVQVSPRLAQEALQSIRTALKDEGKDLRGHYPVRAAAFGCLSSLVQAAPAQAQEALEVIREISKNKNAGADVRAAALGALSSLIQAAPALAQEALEIIREIPKDRNEGADVRAASLGPLSSLVQAAPAQAQEAFEIIREISKDKNEGADVRAAALGSLSSLIQVAPALAQEAFKSILEAIEDQNVQQTALSALEKVSLQRLLESYWARPDTRLIPYITTLLYHTPLVVSEISGQDQQQVLLYTTAGKPDKYTCSKEKVKLFVRSIQEESCRYLDLQAVGRDSLAS